MITNDTLTVESVEAELASLQEDQAVLRKTTLANLHRPYAVKRRKLQALLAVLKEENQDTPG